MRQGDPADFTAASALCRPAAVLPLSELAHSAAVAEAPAALVAYEMRFALETNQGWYRANGIKPGAKLDLAALAAASMAAESCWRWATSGVRTATRARTTKK